MSRLVISSVIGGLSGSRLVLATRPYPATTDDHPARKPAYYCALEGAHAGSLAIGELHHIRGHDPFYIRRDDQRLREFRADTPHTLRMNVRPCDMRSMDESAITQVLQAFGDRKSSKRPEVGLPIYTSGATDPHLAALAMSIFGAEKRLVGAIALSGPSSSLTAEAAGSFASRLREAAERLSSELGAQL